MPILYVTDSADPSVGLMPQTWEIQCPLDIDSNPELLKEFKDGIADLYSYYADGRLFLWYEWEI